MDEKKSDQAVREPTYRDHYQLNFWVWACLQDANSYLEASNRFWSIMGKPSALRGEELSHMRTCQDLAELKKYHFLMSLGRAVRVIEHSYNLFPSIKPLCNAARHWMKEGKDQRDMVEHEDEYLSGRGRKQDDFFRTENHLDDFFPGDQAGIAAAGSLFRDSRGHWLGGRLNVERVASELASLLAEAQKIPIPPSIDPDL